MVQYAHIVPSGYCKRYCKCDNAITKMDFIFERTTDQTIDEIYILTVDNNNDNNTKTAGQNG